MKQIIIVIAIWIMWAIGYMTAKRTVITESCPSIDTNKYIKKGIQKSINYMDNYHLESMQKRFIRDCFVRELNDSLKNYNK